MRSRERGFWNFALPAIAAFAGSVLTNKSNQDIASDAASVSQGNAREQMDFQERMRSTQYQTAVQDMQSAGLNPMLAYSQGGAGTPAGAQGSVTAPHMENPAGVAMSTAAQFRLMSEDAELKKQQARLERLKGDAAEPLAAVGRKSKEGFDRLAENIPDVGGTVAKVVEMVKAELLPGLGSSAAAVVSGAIESAAVIGKTAREVANELPSNIKSVIVNSASAVKRSFDKPEHRKMTIPPALGRAPSLLERDGGGMRGKLGSARSWDFGPNNR